MAPRRSPSERRAESARVAGRTLGAGRVERESDSPAGGAGSTVELPKGEVVRFGQARGSATRSALSSRATLETGSPEATFRKSRPVVPRALHLLVCLSLAKRPCATTTPSSVASVPRGALSDSRRRRSACSGAQAWRYPASMEPRRPIRVYGRQRREVRSPAVDVFRVEITTGARVLWKMLTPPDPVGVESLRGTVVITPDARSYCYSYMRRLGDLFVVDGLK